MNKKIVFFLIVGLILSGILTALSWKVVWEFLYLHMNTFELTDFDFAWMMDKFSDTTRIFSLELMIAIALFISSKRLLGVFLIVIPGLMNIFQLPITVQYTGEFDPIWLDIKQVIRFLGYSITTIQILLLFKDGK